MLALACMVALAAGCGSSTPDAGARGSTDARSSTGARPDAGCFRAPGHRAIAGELVDIPRGLAKRPPLLLVFHGLREPVTYIAGQTGFDGVAARHGFVVAYPNAVRAQKWELNHREGAKDVAHIRSFIAAVVKRVCADPARVYLTGFSNGAGFAYPNAVRAQKWQLNHRDGDKDVAHIRLFIAAVVKRVCADPARVYLTGFSNGAGFAFRAGCELAGQVAAIAPVSGSYRSQDPCHAGAIPTLEIHGRDPWTGTVPRLIADTTRRNHCTRKPRTHHPAPGITRTIWPGCNLERLYNRTIGHTWSRLGAYDTSAEVWSFVSRFSTTGS